VSAPTVRIARRAHRAVRAAGLAAALLAAPALDAQPRLTAAPAAPAPPPAPDSLTEQFEVAGIPVILRRVPANNVVAANLYLLGGTRQLTPETQGIELLLLEASERGTAKYPKEALRRRMAQLGSAIGVSPGLDWTAIGLRSTVAGFDSTWAILADRLVAPRLDPAEVAQVQEVLVTAVRQRRDSPDALLEHLADSIAFVGHPYALDPVGTEASLAALTVDALKRYHAEQVVTSRMLLVVVGNVSRARVERLVRTTLGRLPRGGHAWSLPEPPAALPGAYVIEARTLPTNYLQGWFHGPRADTREYTALRLACAILSGRLFTEVRSRRNLSYSVNAPFEERAFATGGLYVTTTQPDDVLLVMQQQLAALKDGRITDEGLERLVQQFIVTYFLDNETNADQANMLARAALYRGDFRAAARFVDELRSITPTEIRDAARRYMKDVRWAYVGDPRRVTPARLLRF
jgi:zinc protease